MKKNVIVKGPISFYERTFLESVMFTLLVDATKELGRCPPEFIPVIKLEMAAIARDLADWGVTN